LRSGVFRVGVDRGQGGLREDAAASCCCGH
jgi:hypothetical protein